MIQLLLLPPLAGPLQRRCSADDEERLARLYARTTHWRTECEKRYEQVCGVWCGARCGGGGGHTW